MTDPKPFTKERLDDLKLAAPSPHIDPVAISYDDYYDLLDVAEDHARLVEELRDSTVADLHFRIRELGDTVDALRVNFDEAKREVERQATELDLMTTRVLSANAQIEKLREAAQRYSDVTLIPADNPGGCVPCCQEHADLIAALADPTDTGEGT